MASIAEAAARFQASQSAPAEERKSVVTNRVKLASGPTVNPVDILERVRTGKLTPQQAAEMLAASNGGGGKLEVGMNPERGTVCVYGLTSRWPVALYASQWQRLLAVAPAIADYVAKHADAIAAAEAIGKAAKAAA